MKTIQDLENNVVEATAKAINTGTAKTSADAGVERAKDEVTASKAALDTAVREKPKDADAAAVRVVSAEARLRVANRVAESTTAADESARAELVTAKDSLAAAIANREADAATLENAGARERVSELAAQLLDALKTEELTLQNHIVACRVAGRAASWPRADCASLTQRLVERNRGAVSALAFQMRAG
ncbi:MAG: hypothetical protein ACHQPI_02920 [Thermoanaerobaculia bacterium]